MTKNELEDFLNLVLSMQLFEGMNLEEVTKLIPAGDYLGEEIESLNKADLILLLGKAFLAVYTFKKVYENLFHSFEKLAVNGDELGALNDAQASLQRKMIAYHEPFSAHGQKFKPEREKGSITPPIKYIRKFVESNPKLRTKALFKLADKTVKGIGDMNFRTFENRVADARKVIRAEKITV